MSKSKKKTKKTNKANPVRDEIVRIISDVLIVDESEISDSSHLQIDLHADSMDMVEITVNLEEAFSMDISFEDSENCMKVGQVVKMINKKLEDVAA